MKSWPPAAALCLRSSKIELATFSMASLPAAQQHRSVKHHLCQDHTTLLLRNTFALPNDVPSTQNPDLREDISTVKQSCVHDMQSRVPALAVFGLTIISPLYHHCITGFICLATVFCSDFGKATCWGPHLPAQ